MSIVKPHEKKKHSIFSGNAKLSCAYEQKLLYKIYINLIEERREYSPQFVNEVTLFRHQVLVVSHYHLKSSYEDQHEMRSTMQHDRSE